MRGETRRALERTDLREEEELEEEQEEALARRAASGVVAMLACGDTSADYRLCPSGGSVQVVYFILLDQCGGELCIVELGCHMTSGDEAILLAACRP